VVRALAPDVLSRLALTANPDYAVNIKSGSCLEDFSTYLEPLEVLGEKLNEPAGLIIISEFVVPGIPGI
jgi:hypothetical protein